MISKRSPASSPVETEAKIRVSALAPVKRRIVAAGGRLKNVRTMETNTLFDSPAGVLRAAGRSFRVRRYGARGSVTLKGVPRAAGGLKSRVELETRVSSPETLAEILVSLGFVPQFRYEKVREVWRLGRTLICLDDTPLGTFVEIEGQPDAIHRAATRLGLGAGRFMSASYPALWAEAGRSGDMVFTKASRSASSRRPPA
jgi:adenylate cyclase class 2